MAFVQGSALGAAADESIAVGLLLDLASLFHLAGPGSGPQPVWPSRDAGYGPRAKPIWWSLPTTAMTPPCGPHRLKWPAEQQVIADVVGSPTALQDALRGSRMS